MQPSPQDGGRPADPAVWSAWLLRELVLPSLSPADLASLALSFPAALARPCLRSAPAPAVAAQLLDHLVAAAASSDLCAVALVSRDPFLAAAKRAEPGHLQAALYAAGEVARHAPGGDGLLAALGGCLALVDPGAFRGGRVASVGSAMYHACAAGMSRAVAVLGAEPFARAREDVRPAWLHAACERGHADVVRALGRSPVSLGGAEARAGCCKCLAVACRAGHAGVVRALGERPYCLGAADARGCGNGGALRIACEYGRAAVVAALAEPPYGLGLDDARANMNLELVEACKRGHPSVVRALARPPYNLRQRDARSHGNLALCAACQGGHVDVLRELAQEPFALDHCDATARGALALRAACAGGHAAVVVALGQPPFSLGHDEVVCSEAEAIKSAIRGGHRAVLELLAAPPYGAAKEIDSLSRMAELDREAPPPKRTPELSCC
eukprot:m51a1_g1259 hypothetical protein (442) ;mRNA; r:48309-49634